MTPVRVIGIGSDAAGDRAGWEALARLQQADFAARFEPGLVSLECCRFPAQLLQLLEGCRLALLLDAVPAAAGALIDVDPSDLATWPTLHSSHGIGVGEAVQLVECLFDTPPQIRVLGIGAGKGEASCANDRLPGLCSVLANRLDAEISLYLDG